MEPLAHSIKQHTKEWIKSFGEVLYESAKSGLYSVKKDLEVSNDVVSHVNFLQKYK